MTSTFTPSHRGGSGSPLVLLHGLGDTWRSWELILPALERRHDVLALTLAGHAGGPAIEAEITEAVLADAIQSAMDEEGLATAHIVGNSLGGYVALQLARDAEPRRLWRSPRPAAGGRATTPWGRHSACSRGCWKE